MPKSSTQVGDAMPVATSVQKPAKQAASSKPAALDAAGKKEVDKYLANCNGSSLATHYDCGCLSTEYGNALMRLRAERLDAWNNGGEAHARDRLERAKKFAAQQNSPEGAANAQSLYDRTYAEAHSLPNAAQVTNEVFAKNGPARSCTKSGAVHAMNLQRCKELGGKTVMGFPADDGYCNCMANESTALMEQDGLDGSVAWGQANLKCDSNVSKTMKGAKK